MLAKVVADIAAGRAGLQIHTVHSHLAKAVETCRLPVLTWYQATRHTFASQFVLAGGSIEKPSKLMGHSSVTTIERYAHLRADLFRVEEYDRLDVDLGDRDADVVTLKASAEADSGAVAGATLGDREEGAEVLSA